MGIEIIDVCMDSNIVETEVVLTKTIYALTSDFKGVMCIDSFSVEALQMAIEILSGKADYQFHQSWKNMRLG